ncbi:MAG: biopolymer transporter ExbD [Bacteroidetes bacterium]|nr:biopolymer transporter ExbD [Bacteroidota bacterium]
MARKTPEVNAGSMADIAFLMLIFFLVTTTMDVDTGIIRQLSPPPPKDAPIPDINKRNMMTILVNNQDALMINGKPADINTLRADVRDFMSIHPDDPAYPVVEFKTFDYLGEIQVSRGIVSLKSLRGTSYEMYIKIQDQIAAAFSDLRNELAMQKFGKKQDKLVDPNLVDAINKAIKLSVSEAEPEDIGGK